MQCCALGEDLDREGRCCSGAVDACAPCPLPLSTFRSGSCICSFVGLQQIWCRATCLSQFMYLCTQKTSIVIPQSAFKRC